MPSSLAAVKEGVKSIPNEKNRRLIYDFLGFMETSDTSENYRRGNLIVVVFYGKFLGTKDLTDVNSMNDVLGFLDTKKKDVSIDPDKKWIRTWSQAGDCGNGQVPENVGCQNIGSSIQGDENVVNIIGQQQFPAPASTVEPPPPADIATLVIKKKVECVAGAQCANLPAVEDFSMFVQPSNGPDPEPVDGSAAGESVTFSPGEYNTIEKIPEDPDGLVFFESTKSIDCDSNMKGPILAGEVRECTFTNKYEPEPGTLTVVKNVECADPNGRECPDLPNPSEFTLLVSDSDGDTISFPGSAEGTPVNLALDGPYQVTEPEEVPIPDTLDFLGVTFFSECSGSLQPGEHRNCVVTNSYAPDEPPVVVVPATLTVVKNVECAAGQQCPNLGVPSDWNMFVIHEDNKIITIPGSTAGTLVSIEPGNYEVLEGGPVPDGLGFDFTRSSTCFSSTSSPIRAGEERTCTFTEHLYRRLPKETYLCI